MKRIILTLCLAFTAAAASAQYVDDMYDTAPAKPKKQKSVSTQQHQPSVQTQPTAQTTQSLNGDNKELITTYEEALERRLNALRSTVEMDDAYWELLQQYQAILEAKYDKHLYNIVVVGNDMWVEPQAITSLFDGSDPAEGAIKYNEQIKNKLTAHDVQAAQQVSSSAGGGGESISVQPVTINLVVDPWYNSYWNYNFGFSWNFGYHGWGGWYDPWFSPWHRPYYDPWYNPWYRPYYSPAYYGNPRGTYYGNSAYRSTRNQSGWGLGGNTRQPRGAEGTNSRRYNRRSADLKPTGVNTVSGIGNRSNRGNRSEIRERGSIPVGGVADLRNSGATFRGRAGTTGTIERPSRTNTGVRTPSVAEFKSNTYERSTRNNNRTERNVYERPTQRPTRNETTYTRPTRTETTYTRPTTSQPSRQTFSRPSGGGFGGGGARPSRGR